MVRLPFGIEYYIEWSDDRLVYYRNVSVYRYGYFRAKVSKRKIPVSSFIRLWSFDLSYDVVLPQASAPSR